MKEIELNDLVVKVNSGDKKALESIILYTKDYVYNLSLKMLLLPEDAQDATQEILIKIITHLSTFRFKSKFSTWVYRIAINYLLTEKRKVSNHLITTFSEYSTLIDSGISLEVKYTSNQGLINLLEEEVKVSCTQGLLLCLKPEDRIVYILADILGFNSNEGSQILEITPTNFRKKKSRSREKIKNFLQKKCGLVDPSNACRCTKKVDFLIEKEMIDPTKLKFAELQERSIDLMEKIEDADRSLAVYRSVPFSNAPQEVLNSLKSIISNI